MRFIKTSSLYPLMVIAGLWVAACLAGCHKKDYPCPGLGQTSEADMNLFDEDGQLKESKKQKKTKDKNNGLVNKKQPKKLRAPRKTHI
jgi:hypothetical protein